MADLPPHKTPPIAQALPMPGDDTQASLETASPTQTPTAMKQVMQLIIVPGLIVLAAVAVALPIWKMVNVSSSLENHLTILQSDHRGGLAKDRWVSAFEIATMIPSIDDPAKRKQLSSQLIAILQQLTESIQSQTADAADSSGAVQDPQGRLRQYLIASIGLLGQPEGLDVILGYAHSPEFLVRHGSVLAIRKWANPIEARVAIDTLVDLLADPQLEIVGIAASGLGEFAIGSDQQVLDALRLAMEDEHINTPQAAGDIAIALAKLGDPVGSHYVVSVLLDRQALGQLGAGGTGGVGGAGRAGVTLGPASASPSGQVAVGLSSIDQDIIMLGTLAGVNKMSDLKIWEKVRQIADTDPSTTVRTAAKEAAAWYDEQVSDVSEVSGVSGGETGGGASGAGP